MEGIIAIWQRDIIKFFRDRARLFGSFSMPILFLIIFGGGMGGSMEALLAGPGGDPNFNYIEFIFPGIVSMTLLMTSIFSSLSVIQDKEFGYMREILVSPISRVNIAIGNVLGSSTVALMQGLLMFVLVPFIGVRVDFISILQLIPVMFLMACAFSSLGLLIASVLKSSQGFQLLVQVLVMPMIFLSGALFPINNMPDWMDFLVKINPVTYGVDLMKKIMVDVDQLSPMIVEAMGLNLEVFGRSVIMFEQILFLVVFMIVLVILATISFSRANA
ncbi:ABC transporter permease [Evansella sp. AB-rgal1]|uniref:ABC transporter permease n=1 Tax=Evansella sp. AB-rgal1 TaxID=3242696 RepID=UPI00359CE52F